MGEKPLVKIILVSYVGSIPECMGAGIHVPLTACRRPDGVIVTRSEGILHDFHMSGTYTRAKGRIRRRVFRGDAFSKGRV